MIEIDEFLPEVMPHAPNVPEPVALRYIREAAQYLCKEARCWREWEELQITGDLEGDGLSSIQDSKILEVEEAWLVTDEGQFELAAMTALQLDRDLPRWRIDYEATEGPPIYATQLKPNQVIVVPRAIGVLKVRLVLAPARLAETLPEFLLEDHSALIGKGAAAEILMLPDPEFSNPQFGAALKAGFQKEVAEYKSKADKTQLKAPRRTKPSFF